VKEDSKTAPNALRQRNKDGQLVQNVEKRHFIIAQQLCAVCCVLCVRALRGVAHSSAVCVRVCVGCVLFVRRF
jgi:hypothetical protein